MRIIGKPTILRAPLVSRRRFLKTAAAAGTVGAVACPAISRAGDRPQVSHGVQSGDVSINSGVVWARADRPARMQVELATTDSFKDIRGGVFVDALPESDLTAKALMERLPAGQDIFYRIRFQDLSQPTITGDPVIGRFRTAPADLRSISFVWSGDTAGQGWGIDEARGGMRTYATMRKSRPDFFIHSRRQHLRGRRHCGRGQASQRRDLEEHGHRGKVEAGGDAGRVPRQL